MSWNNNNNNNNKDNNNNNNNNEVCQPSTLPSVFTKVGDFTGWIQTVTNILN